MQYGLVAAAIAGLVTIVPGGCKRPAEDRREQAAPPEQAAGRAPGSGPGGKQDGKPEDKQAVERELEAPAGQEERREAPAPPEARAAPDHGPVSTELKTPPAELAQGLALVRVAHGLDRPVALEHAPGDTTGRLFVIEQHKARIRILRPGEQGLTVDREPFFDMKGNVARGNEQGLLGLAFHPRFAENRRLYVNYTDRKGTTFVVEYQVDAKHPDRVDMSTAREILELGQPYSNHNGGNLEFGPDGKLYVGTGDGGAAGDPLRAGQDSKNLLAKMLRFDVDAAEPRPEIVQMGLRNPWRYAFDPKTGDLYIGDVGQNRYEMVHVVAGDNIEGHNFGWNVVEGNHCYQSRNCNTSQFTPAVIVYEHREGCSITGGMVYRGKAIPELEGVYFYGDYCTAIIRSFRWSKDGVRQHWDWTKALDPKHRVREISSFGVDREGELYIVSLAGEIWKLVKK